MPVRSFKLLKHLEVDGSRLYPGQAKNSILNRLDMLKRRLTVYARYSDRVRNKLRARVWGRRWWNRVGGRTRSGQSLGREPQ